MAVRQAVKPKRKQVVKKGQAKPLAEPHSLAKHHLKGIPSGTKG